MEYTHHQALLCVHVSRPLSLQLLWPKAATTGVSTKLPCCSSWSVGLTCLHILLQQGLPQTNCTRPSCVHAALLHAAADVPGRAAESLHCCTRARRSKSHRLSHADKALSCCACCNRQGTSCGALGSSKLSYNCIQWPARSCVLPA
jgi:hypothetical protein